MRADEPRQRVGTLDEAAELDILPALAVGHGGRGDALKQMGAFLYRAKECIGVLFQGLGRGRAVDLQIEAIELLPHFRAALLSHLTQIFTGAGDAGDDGRGIGFIESENVGERRGVDLAVVGCGRLRSFEQLRPALSAGVWQLVEAELEIHVEQASCLDRALEVTAHPVQSVRDAGEHRIFEALIHARSTQVSLLPPPCEELTTSEPRRSATRVSPPGTSVTLSP